ncbi:MAG: methionyl-tRNA formyltransferase [Candidatus Izemoplasmataceae bacterium]
MNIVFMGTPEFSVPILEALIKQYEVTLVVTQPDKIVGRKKTLTHSPIKKVALEHNIEVFQPKSIKKDYERVLEVNPDLIITAAYGQIIPEVLLNAPKLKAINVHASLLPKYRGGAPIQRAIMNHESSTGVTIMYMSKAMDAGDIIAQESLSIKPKETGESLFNKLSILGRDLLMKTLPSIINQTNQRFKQDPSLVSYAPIIKPSEEWLDFRLDANDLEAKVRAFYKEPNTYTTLDGLKLKVIKAESLKENLSDEAGVITKIDKQGIKIQCGNGTLVVTYLQLESKKAMTSIDFMNGLGRNMLKVGKKLGC